MGHGFALFFIVLGLGFVALGLNDSFNSWLDANSTCDSGSCPENSARTTFIFLGVSFIAAGVVSGLVTEFAIRKTRRLLSHVATFSGSEGATLESLGNFLEPFGIDLAASQGGKTSIRSQVSDLRHLRKSEPPSGPEELSAYLKSLGITVDESALRNAHVIDSRRAIRSDDPNQHASQVSPMRADRVRETATILRKRDRGETAGDQRLLELELEVRPPGRVPYRVTVASLVRETLAALLIEGSTLNVRVDPNDDNSVTIDWAEN
jgi:hypothetical protein